MLWYFNYIILNTHCRLVVRGWQHAACRDVRRRSCSFSTTWAPRQQALTPLKTLQINKQKRFAKTNRRFEIVLKHRAPFGFSRRDTAERCWGGFFCFFYTWTPWRPYTHIHTQRLLPLQTPFMSKCVRVSYLDPNITVGSQGRVIQTSRGSFTNHPLEGCCRP